VTQSLYSIILPLASVGNTIMISISSPPTCPNYYTGMDKHYCDDGTKAFNIRKFTFRCDACKIKGVEKICPHKRKDVPKHKYHAGSTNDAVRAIMAGNNLAQYLTEELGESNIDAIDIFPKEHLDFFKSIETGRHSDSSSGILNNRFIVSVDPAPHDKCHLGISSFYITKDKKIVLSGLDSVKLTKSDSVRFSDSIIQHINTIYELYNSNADIYLIIEINSSTVLINYVWKLVLEQCPRVKPVAQKTGNAIGTWTTSLNKYEMICHMQRVINDRFLRWSPILFTNSFKSREHAIDELIAQVSNTAFNYNKMPPLVESKNSSVFTDMFLSFTFGIYWYSQLIKA